MSQIAAYDTSHCVCAIFSVHILEDKIEMVCLADFHPLGSTKDRKIVTKRTRHEQSRSRKWSRELRPELRGRKGIRLLSPAKSG